MSTIEIERRTTGWPRWLEDLRLNLAVRSQYLLSGNIHDIYVIPGEGELRLASILQCLHAGLQRDGFEFLVVYDPIDGLRVYPEEKHHMAALQQMLGPEGPDFRKRALALAEMRDILRTLTASNLHRIAVVMDYASRLVARPGNLGPEEHAFFSFCHKLSLTTRPTMRAGERACLFNVVIWLLDKENDAPEWLVIGNDRVRSYVVPLPDYDTRAAAASVLATDFEGYGTMPPHAMATRTEEFAGGTEGLRLSSMISISELASSQSLPFERIHDAVMRYKLGITDDPWKQRGLRAKVANARKEFEKRVKGQPEALEDTVSILMRSVLGLSGAQRRGRSGQPRGVMFFAGPTGVGKTELARTMTKQLFDNENAYIRFDMSEFSEEHSAARLIGAPPGYVGYEAGGELTRAVREKPFSVILFDEIEKAHPRILDKFLQILEDGRLTDGRGNTAYFSESVLVFTSNLGIYERKTPEQLRHDPSPPKPLIAPNTQYSELKAIVTDAIRNFFTYELQRPEILNRFGENIVVFNFIDGTIAEDIFDGALDNVVNRVRDEHQLNLSVSEKARQSLLDECRKDLRMGGRGILNKLESAFVNPLARALFNRDLKPGASLVVESILVDDGRFKVEIA